MIIFPYFFFFLVPFICSFPTKRREAHSSVPPYLPNAPRIANQNFEAAPVSLLSKEEGGSALQLLEASRKSHTAVHPKSQLLQQRTQITEVMKLSPDPHTLPFSTGNGNQNNAVIKTNPVTKSNYGSRRKVTNSPVDFNPLNFRNAPKNVASKEDWNRIAQLLEDGRGTRPTYPTAHPYLRNGQNDGILVRPIPRYGQFQNEGELEKHISVDEEMMNNIRDNNNAHNQFEYDRKRKVPDNHLFEAAPNNFRQTPINIMTNEHEEYITRVLDNFVSNEDWDHYLQLSEAIRGTRSAVHSYWWHDKNNWNHISNVLKVGSETQSAARPHLRNGQSVQAHQSPPLCQECSQISREMEKGISGDLPVSISKAISSDNRLAVVSKLPRFFF